MDILIDIINQHGYLILVFLFGIIAGIIDAFAAMGALLYVPVLIFIGLPPHAALACDRMGTIGWGVSMMFKHIKAGSIVWKWVPVFAGLSLIGGIIGANLTVNIDPVILKNLLAIIILIMLPVMIFRAKLGVIDTSGIKTKKQILLGVFLFGIMQVYAGLIGAGTGPFILLILTGLVGLTILQVQGTTTPGWIVVSITSIVIFEMAGMIDWLAALTSLAGMTLGGYIGSSKAIAVGNQSLRKYIIGACAISALALFLK